MRNQQRKVLKINLYKKEVDLYIDMIRDIIPSKRMIILHPHEYYISICDDPRSPLIKYGMAVTIPDPEIFNRIKFEWIKFIKTKPDPEDRVADYEWRDENNLPDFNKLERLIESRKTVAEKKKEFEEELEIKMACEKYDIEYFGPLRGDL